ncbi:MAG: phosphate ABC transporter permease PstA [Planctomycetes bacterium]|nr:phosphate ABC transporter permease PstA [Planctomycetota bacterium]
MRTKIRNLWNHLFTSLSALSIVFLVAALLIFLVPMLKKGLTAVFFRGTVEYRKMQMDRFDRGDKGALKAETATTEASRQEIYALFDHFSRGIDTEQLADEAKGLYRQYGNELRYREVASERYAELRSRAKEIRKELMDAFESTDKEQIAEHLDAVASLKNDVFSGTAVEKMFAIAEDYRRTIQTVDLSKRDEYAQELAAVKEELLLLFGPRPDEESPQLAQFQYGATRWDIAQKHLGFLVYEEKWVSAEDGQTLEKTFVRRDDPENGSFGGTELAPLFSLVEDHIDSALNPRFTFYWQYFIDGSTPGHYFGGVGPEILGTLTLTILAMCFAVPLGVISAAYLVEYAGDNLVVKIIRICINTLAGVPSIVYGLFGLAFFVTYVTGGEKCILSASMTLSLLVLPVIIRASEEAIRAVPQTYREAAMGLGAGKFRTFVTVTMPAAGPGILTGIILSLSRAAGETAPILFAGAVALGPVPNFAGAWWKQPTMALSYGCYDITVGDKLASLVPHNQFGMVMALILLVLCLNIVAIVIRSRMSKKLRGY